MSTLANPGSDLSSLQPGQQPGQLADQRERQSERSVIIYLVGGVLVLTTFIAKAMNAHASAVAELPAMAGAIILSVPLLFAALREINEFRLSSSTLASLAIAAALASGQYTTAGVLAFVLLIADQFVRRTAWGALRAIEQLIGLTPDTARLVEDGVEREVRVGELRVGQVVRVRPGENLPVDGTITEGTTTINQASLTGESVPVEVQSGDAAYAGTANLTGNIDIRVTQVGDDTTIGKVTQLIREAEQSKSPRQLIIEQVARFFVPVVISIAAIVLFFMFKSEVQATREAAVSTFVQILVVTAPAALLLASPTAMVAAFAAAARLGILIKATTYLEAAANIDAVVMDKTGTMTTGQFGVSKLAPAPGVDGATLLRVAVSAEQHSNHPLAQSIVKTALSANISPEKTTKYAEVHGRGVHATTETGEIHAGRKTWIVELSPDTADEVDAVEQKIEGMSGVHVMQDGKYLGAVGLADTVRKETKPMIARLRDLGVRHVAMFTGDRLSVAKRVGTQVGVDTIEAECLPEEKHEQIRALVASGVRTLMVGDGINDGPSLAAADVGVAMGLHGSDIAANSAGVALMTDDLRRIPFLIELSRKSRAIITQNIVIAIVMALGGLALAATGTLEATGVGSPLAALYQLATGVIVAANSFRLFRFGESFAESEQDDEQVGMKRREGSVRGLAGA